MKTLSKTEYENETDLYTLTNKLFGIGLPGIYFAKAAICIAKYSECFIKEKDKKVSLKTLEIAEKYLSGEATVKVKEFRKAADSAYRAAVYAAEAATDCAIDACDMLKRAIPWNLVCSFQIAKCSGKENNENFIQEITKDENLINFTTILLEDENLRKEFQFLMKDYMNK